MEKDGKYYCDKCGQGVIMSWTCPKCERLLCDICSGMTKPDSRPKDMGGFTTQTLGGGKPRCPICDVSKHPEAKGEKANFVKVVTKDSNRYECYTAQSRNDALDFLRNCEVKESCCYVLVETPEGRFGKDLIGIYDSDTQETLELGKRKPLPKLSKSQNRCARCGYYVLKATSVPKNASFEELKSQGVGFYCTKCETAWCSFCVSPTKSVAICGICGRKMYLMDF